MTGRDEKAAFIGKKTLRSVYICTGHEEKRAPDYQKIQTGQSALMAVFRLLPRLSSCLFTVCVSGVLFIHSFKNKTNRTNNPKGVAASTHGGAAWDLAVHPTLPVLAVACEDGLFIHLLINYFYHLYYYLLLITYPCVVGRGKGIPFREGTKQETHTKISRFNFFYRCKTGFHMF